MLHWMSSSEDNRRKSTRTATVKQIEKSASLRAQKEKLKKKLPPKKESEEYIAVEISSDELSDIEEESETDAVFEEGEVLDISIPVCPDEIPEPIVDHGGNVTFGRVGRSASVAVNRVECGRESATTPTFQVQRNPLEANKMEEADWNARKRQIDIHVRQVQTVISNYTKEFCSVL